MINACRAAAMLALLSAAAAYGQPRSFTPPRLVRAALPLLPGPTVVGAGEVIVELTVNETGVVTRPIPLRSTPPYTQLVLDAVSRWQFEPARFVDEKGMESRVSTPVVVAAVYRPPTFVNAPTVGDPPKDLAAPSGDVAYPTALSMPVHPPQALEGAVLLFELALDERAAVIQARPFGASFGYDGVTRDALVRWRFRPATFRGRPAAASTYVVFGFPSPVINPPFITPPVVTPAKPPGAPSQP
jgi:hypothetical protein